MLLKSFRHGLALAPIAAVALTGAATAGDGPLRSSASVHDLRPQHTTVRCRGGFVHVVVRRRHVCRPAADLRLAIVSSPEANRVGGTFTYAVTVANVGRRSAARVVLTADAGADHVSASPSLGSCSAADGPLNSTCVLGTLASGMKAEAKLVVRATVQGPLRLSVRVSSSSPDARPKNNAAIETTRVTEPDFVRGRGVRPTAGGGPRPPVTIEVDAISGPHGDDPAGTFWTKYPSLELRGRVVCLTVSGNRASVGGVVEQTNDPNNNPVGSTVHLGLTDGAEPGTGRDTEATYLKMQDAHICPVPLQEFPEIPLTDGNFAVHDELP